MSVNPLKYKPPPISQRDTLLAKDGVDDCLVVSITQAAGSATLGEIFVWPNGNPMGRRNRTALAKRARKALGPSFTTGSLNIFTAGPSMLASLVPDAPSIRPVDITFPKLRELLRTGYCAVLAGNPSHIKVTSTLKRAGDIGHAVYLHEETDKGILGSDPFKPFSPRFGEWWSPTEVRQFAYKDSDKTLTGCFVIERGEWTREALTAKSKDRRIKALRGINDAQLEELAARPPMDFDVTSVKDKLAISMNYQQEAWDLLT